MAVVVNRVSGAWSSAATWALVENSTWTQIVTTQESGTTALTTSFQSGQNFTVPVAQTLQGLLLKVSSRTTTGGNTVSVRIFNVSTASAVANTTVTVDAVDMPIAGGWVFFKFPTNASLATGTNYRIEILSNVAASASFFRKTVTAANWTFGLVTTTSQSPAAADQVLIVGENSSFNVFQTLTVTVDNTAPTLFGPNTTGALALEVSSKGVLSFSTASGSNFILNLDGNIYINDGGEIRIGNASNPIPSTSTAAINFDCTTNVQWGVSVRTNGILNTHGAPKVTKAYMASEALPGDTQIVTDVSTAWSTGDVLAVATTGRNVIAQSETVSVTSSASGVMVPVTALLNLHDGSSITTEARAEVINLTRNVRISGVNTTIGTYMNTAASGTVNCVYTQFQYFGSSTAGSRGIESSITAGTFSFSGCSFANFEPANAVGILIGPTAIASVQNCVFYRQNLAAISFSAQLTTNTVSIVDVWAIGGTGMGSTALFNLTVNAGTYTGLNAAGGAATGVSFFSSGVSSSLTVSGIVSHSCVASNITINTISQLTQSNALFTNLVAYRGQVEGILLGSTITGACINTVIDGGRLFGNVSRGLTTGFVFSCQIRNMLIYNETGYDQPNGIAMNNHIEDTYIDDCEIGVILPHSVSDVRDVCPNNEHIATFRNCLFGSSTEFSGLSNYTPQSYVGSARHDKTTGVHKMFKKYGIITLDSTFYKVQSPSQRLTPSDSVNKLLSQEKRVAVPLGQAAQISVWVRKSTIGDGTAYIGNEVQIIALRDPSIGIFSDTVIATSSSLAYGAFEKITGTTPVVTDNGVVKLVATCDGVQGWVNIDLWTVGIV
jgi:hypothetical protein